MSEFASGFSGPPGGVVHHRTWHSRLQGETLCHLPWLERLFPGLCPTRKDGEFCPRASLLILLPRIAGTSRCEGKGSRRRADADQLPVRVHCSGPDIYGPLRAAPRRNERSSEQVGAPCLPTCDEATLNSSDLSCCDLTVSGVAVVQVSRRRRSPEKSNLQGDLPAPDPILCKAVDRDHHGRAAGGNRRHVT